MFLVSYVFLGRTSQIGGISTEKDHQIKSDYIRSSNAEVKAIISSLGGKVS